MGAQLEEGVGVDLIWDSLRSRIVSFLKGNIVVASPNSLTHSRCYCYPQKLTWVVSIAVQRLRRQSSCKGMCQKIAATWALSRCRRSSRAAKSADRPPAFKRMVKVPSFPSLMFPHAKNFDEENFRESRCTLLHNPSFGWVWRWWFDLHNSHPQGIMFWRRPWGHDSFYY